MNNLSTQEQVERTTTVLSAIGSASCIGGLITACAVEYPAAESPVMWIASLVLWTATAICAALCIRLHSRRARRIDRDRRRLGYIRYEPGVGFRREERD